MFYDPDKPERAMLETGVHCGARLGLGMGAVFCFLRPSCFQEEELKQGQ
jgi:hypothetical protein